MADPAAAHIPVPLQAFPGVNVDPEQLADPHDVPLVVRWHAPLPSQLPSLPQEPAASGAQSLCGSWPSCTGAHMPSACPVVAFRQAVQAPVQALSQQTWSGEQKPDPHSVAAMQVVPRVFVTLHVPLLQYCPAAQSAAAVHGFAQPVDAHGYVPQSVFAGVVHAPAPLHCPAPWKVWASVQVPCPQAWPAPTLLHCPAPSQVPS
jgi:hypothetical protein